MTEDQMRAEFEEWAKTDQGLDMFRLPHGGYRSFATHQAWSAWQASRKMVCVELPLKVTRGNGFDSEEDDEFYNLAIDYCAAALDKAGVAYK